MFKGAVLTTMLASALATIVVHAPKADLTLDVARTESEREHGLMDRRVVSPHAGMLFVFERDENVDFWMKDTLVPLDMIFIAADGTVRRVFSNVAVVAPTLPDEQIPREGAQAKYVIELAAGEASADGIVAGVKLDLRGAPPPQ
ncbi:MAG: DUF192 domain-containing protein [Candidatus Cybelea sp.]|jgi:uncharacterized membrane protein (UPF0127 family)